MATFETRDIIDEMIANDGCYRGDPPPLAIYEYKNIFDATLWFVAYVEGDLNSLFTSDHVKQETIKQLWPASRR